LSGATPPTTESHELPDGHQPRRSQQEAAAGNPKPPLTEQEEGYFRTGRYLNKLVRDELDHRHRDESQATGELSAKERKDQEDEACIGGMRNPRKAVAKLPRWQTWGERAAQAIDRTISEDPRVLELAQEMAQGMSKEQVAKAQTLLERLGAKSAAEIAQITNTTDWMEVGATKWRWRLMKAVSEATADPDQDVPEWFGKGTPLGINEPIKSRGIYPLAPPTKAQMESAEYLAQLGSHVEVDRNYASFHQHIQESAEELDRLLAEGHIERIGSWTDVKGRWPDARATKLATLVKARPDGSVKTRFIADMLRSGVNGLSQAGERIVLPRGCDLVRDILDLQELGPGSLELFTADVSDAFLNLPVMESERGYTVIKLSDGTYASYRGVPFGLASAPLLWGRAAAWIARATQAIHDPRLFRLQLYVDDPIAVVKGDRYTRAWLILRTFALWYAFGAKLAIHKAGIGRRIKWIGATFSIITGGVQVSIDEERIQKLLGTVSEALQSDGLVKGVRNLAGELSWVAGIIPTIRPFVNMLWAAV
jgi:hypothetical protein